MAEESRKTRPAASILFAGTPAPFPLPDAWRARYHPDWVFEKIETREMVLDRVLPGLCEELLEQFVHEYVAGLVPDALDELLLEDAKSVQRYTMAAVLDAMVAEVVAETLRDVKEEHCQIAGELVVEDLVRDMCEEVTAEVWHEETPRDSFVLLTASAKKQPRLKPMGRVQDNQGFWRTASMATNNTLFYTTLHSTHMT